MGIVLPAGPVEAGDRNLAPIAPTSGHRRRRCRRVARRVLVAAGAMALLAGCSDQASTASGSAPTSVSATCTSLQSLSKAVSGLVASGGGAGAIASVPGRIDTVQRAVDDARTTASAQLRTEIDAFAASVRSLRSTLASVGTASDLGATVTAIQRAVTDVSASWQRLRSAAQTELAGCDLGSG